MSPGNRVLRVGVFQPWVGGAPDERSDRLEDALAGRNLDLVVCPELFLSGYDVGEALRERAEPAEGASARRLAKLAGETGTAIAYGYPEAEDGQIYNSVLVIDPAGRTLANHRKTVLPPGFEADFFATSPTPPPIFEIGGLRTTVLICYEAEFPEGARWAATAGAELVLVPTALAERWHSVAHQMMPTRAFENGLWLLYSNHAGQERETQYLGHSCILAPDGVAAARAGRGETLIEATIDRGAHDTLRRRLPYLSDLPVLSRALRPPAP